MHGRTVVLYTMLRLGACNCSELLFLSATCSPSSEVRFQREELEDAGGQGLNLVCMGLHGSAKELNELAEEPVVGAAGPASVAASGASGCADGRDPFQSGNEIDKP